MNVAYETARRAWPTLVISLTLLALVMSLARCDSFVEEHYCAGYPEVMNPIADIGLVAGAELYVRDLESRPFVFGHTHNAPLWYEAEPFPRWYPGTDPQSHGPLGLGSLSVDCLPTR